MKGTTHDPEPQSTEGLCYLPAARVEGPAGTLANLEMCNGDDETVGTVDGVLIDAPARRVRYFVLKSRNTPACERFLLPVETIVHVEQGSDPVRLEATNAGKSLLPFDPAAARPFSEEDALTAMFAPHAA